MKAVKKILLLLFYITFPLGFIANYLANLLGPPFKQTIYDAKKVKQELGRKK